MTTDAEMAADLVRDELAVRQLAAAYSNAVMRRDAAAAAAVYTEDGVLAAFYGPEIVGRAAIRDALQRVNAQLDFIVQSCAAEIVTIDAAAGTARSSWSVTEWMRHRERTELSCCFGIYEDMLVRTAEGWRFVRRRFHPFYRGTVPSEGKLYRAPILEHAYPSLAGAGLPG